MAFSKFINQRVVIIFSDGESVKRREGKLTEAVSDGITLIDIKTNEPIFIPMSRIIRIEKVGNGGNQK